MTESRESIAVRVAAGNVCGVTTWHRTIYGVAQRETCHRKPHHFGKHWNGTHYGTWNWSKAEILTANQALQK